MQMATAHGQQILEGTLKSIFLATSTRSNTNALVTLKGSSACTKTTALVNLKGSSGRRMDLDILKPNSLPHSITELDGSENNSALLELMFGLFELESF